MGRTTEFIYARRLEMNGRFRVGLDVGSTTIKMVILDEQNAIVFRAYRRHFSNIMPALRALVDVAHRKFSQAFLSITMTGSAAIGLAKSMNVSFVQEVAACTKAVKKFIPQTDTVIELGGEDAKITYLNGSFEQRMNGVCAGGTGAFIDQMAVLLDTDAAGLNNLARRCKQIYPVASRCGVFAKTDVQALMNEGVEKEDIAASVLQAVVNQTVGSLAQGRRIGGNVAFLGGPLHFLPELKKRFVETLELKNGQIITPEDSPYFVAMGAALESNETPVHAECLHERLAAFYGMRSSGVNRLAPLFANREELERFRRRHGLCAAAHAELRQYKGRAYLGVDAGSTTVKLVLLSEKCEILYSLYSANKGKPLETVIAMLKNMYAVLPQGADIAAACVTGYGERLIQKALRFDLGEVETIAHFKAANAFLPGVEFVLDIGGQDMKSFFIRDGVMDSVLLNEACSAGCGSFLETFAHSVGMDAQAFAALAVEASSPVDLGTRCTVFMNSKVKQAQKEGASLGDISAGLAVSVIKNALYKVIRFKGAADLGEKIVVQGGVFYNEAALRALEKILERQVVRPDIAGLMGAYGAALIARERLPRQVRSQMLSLEELQVFRTETSRRRCSFCGNRCALTIQRFPSGESNVVGNRCERGNDADGRRKEEAPSIYAFKYRRLFQYRPLDTAARGSIGIPRILNMYEDYPFWFTLFTALNYRVVLSAQSSPKLYRMGLETIPSETVCYPAKLAHGHIADLVAKGVKKIFYPCIPRGQAERPAECGRYNCPVVASYPESIAANMEVLETNGVAFWRPFLPIGHRKRLIKRLHAELAVERISYREIARAVDLAYAEQAEYRAAVKKKGKEILDYVAAHTGRAVVLAGRPYHVDPAIHHGLPELIQYFGLPVLSEDVLEPVWEDAGPLRVVDQWVYHARLYRAAVAVGESQYPELVLIQLNSFGCGLDSITMDQVRELLSRYGKTYLSIKLDEISNLGAARIRVRSLLVSLQERKAFPKLTRIGAPPAVFTAEAKKKHTVLAPQMSPIHFQFVQAALENAGYHVVIPEVDKASAIEAGLKYVHNDVCYPAVLVIGHMLCALQSGKYDLDRTSIVMAQTGGGCRASNYIALLRKALADCNLSHIPVFSLWGEKSPGFSLTVSLCGDLVTAVLYGDLLSRVLHRVRPYETERGAAGQLYTMWAARCRQALLRGERHGFEANVRRIVEDFDTLPLVTEARKTRIGIVGEILVKYHPWANNALVDLLEQENAEVSMPDLLHFFQYTAYDRIVERDLLAGGLGDKLKAQGFLRLLDFRCKCLQKALADSRRFTPPHTIKQLAALAKPFLSLGNMAGEGWLLTAEIAALLQSGVNNIVCVQPFGCLPNHVVAKGMFKRLRRYYPDANIVALDYDAAESEVNQLNRIKLLLSIAKESQSLR